MAKAYEWLGRRSTDAAMSFNYNSERDTDITGKPFSVDTAGVETFTLEVIINGKSALARKVNRIATRRHELSKLDIPVVVANKYCRIGADFTSGIPEAYRTTAKLVPGEWGSGNAELRATVEVAFVGGREFGTFDPGTVSADWDWLYESGTFAAESSEPTESQIHFKDGDASRAEWGIFYEHDGATI